MTQVMQFFFAPAIMLTLVLSVVFSFKSRRSNEPIKRGIQASRMNISMGIMLVLIACVQLMFSAESTVRIILGALFMLLGLFNLFAGIRNLGTFRRQQEHAEGQQP